MDSPGLTETVVHFIPRYGYPDGTDTEYVTVPAGTVTGTVLPLVSGVHAEKETNSRQISVPSAMAPPSSEVTVTANWQAACSVIVTDFVAPASKVTYSAPSVPLAGDPA